MTQRERKLATVLLGVVAVLGAGLAFHALALQPYRDARDRLEKAENDLDKKNADLLKEKKQLANLIEKDPRLEVWQKIALPSTSTELRNAKGLNAEDKRKAHRRNLQVEYDRYLRELLKKSRFQGAISIKAQDVKEQFEDLGKNKSSNTKAPVLYERMPFTVNGHAKLAAVVQMFESFHRTRLLQQIRTFTISVVDKRGEGSEKTASELLNVHMTVEALIVPGAEERPRLEPNVLPKAMRVLASAKPKVVKGELPRILVDPKSPRPYLDITRKDPFLGLRPLSDPTVGVGGIGENKAGGPREKAEDVLRFVRLTTLSFNGRRWEGYIYDLGRGGAEKRVNAVTLTEFAIHDKYANALLEGEVMLIDEEQMIFKAGGKFYRLRVGDFFHLSVRKPLTTKEVKQLGLDPDTKTSAE